MESLDRNYRLFGIMKDTSADQKADISQVRNLRGFLDNDKRLKYKLDGAEVKEVPTIVLTSSLRENFSLKNWLTLFKMEHTSTIGTFIET